MLIDKEIKFWQEKIEKNIKKLRKIRENIKLSVNENFNIPSYYECGYQK